MTGDNERPDFIDCWLQDLQEDRKQRGTIALVPVWLLVCMATGGLVGATLPETLLTTADSIVSLRVAFLGAVVTLNGLLLALAWTSFSRIYESACAPGFSSWLRSKGMLTKYYFVVDYIHLTQVAALVIAAASLTLALYDSTEIIPVNIHRAAFAATIASFCYALKYAAGSVRVMQDLVWYRTIFEEDQGRRAAANVTTLPGRDQR